MEWRILLSRHADKFLSSNHLEDIFVIDPIKKAIQKIEGKKVSVNVKRLTGNWSGYYRIRVGKTRIIFGFDPHERTIFVEAIDFRGNIYK
jgi:mRNA interferase RelE/StbE